MTTTTAPHALDTIGPQIAAVLPGWRCTRTELGRHYLIQDLTPEPYNDCRSNAPGIHLTEDRGRIHISGNWPTDSTHGWRTMTPSQLCGDHNAPRISVALTKDPAKIAADIARRFLPAYLDLHAKCCARIKEDTLGEDLQQAVTRDLAALMGDTNARPAQASFHGRQAYGHVDVNHGGETGTLEIRGAIPIIRAALLAAQAAGAFVR